jgi:hypothetical protein
MNCPSATRARDLLPFYHKRLKMRQRVASGGAERPPMHQLWVGEAAMDVHLSSRFAVRRSLVLSLLGHLVALLVCAAILQPAGSGPSPPLSVEIRAVEPVPDFETLVMSEALQPEEAGDRLGETDTPQFAAPGQTTDMLSIDMPLLSGRNGAGDDVSSRRGSGTGASFFGTVAEGDRFVYIVDISASMESGKGARAGHPSRLVRAIAELQSSIDRLLPDQSFYVILFSGETRRLFDDQTLLPRAVRATPDNKRRLNEWLGTIETGSSTDPRAAMRLGLGMEPSAVFLLSDGEFNGQKNGVNSDLLNGNPTIFEVIERHNRSQTPVHTIAYEDTSNCKTMELIAHSTGGEYRFVPPHGSGPKPSRAVVLRNNRASHLLARARVLESRGREKQAQTLYRRIQQDYAGTPAAQAAADKTSPLTASGP